MSKSTLLWLLAHGVLVGYAALGLAVLAGVAAGVLLARRSAARDASVLRARLGQPIHAAAELREGALVTLAGRVAPDADGAELAVTDVGYQADVRGSAPARETLAQVGADPLVLAVGSERIEIAGPVDLVIGSGPARRVRRVEQAPPALRPGLEPWGSFLGKIAAELRTIAHGDAVWVRGVARREVAAELGTYRDRPTRWRLVPPPEEKARVRLAFAGAPRPRAAAMVAWCTFSAAASGLAAAGASWAVGEHMIERLAFLCGEEAPAEPLTLANRELVGTAACAAVTPSHSSLVELDVRLRRRTLEDPGELALLVALHQNEGHCVEAAALWLEHGSFVRGAEAAEACRAYGMAAHAWYVAGDFGRASDAWARVLDLGAEPRDPTETWHVSWRNRRQFGVRVHLLAGRPDRAAAEARRFAADVYGPHAHKDHRYTDDRAERATCIADLLDARAGDANAVRRLAGAHPPEARLACAILLADLLRGAERLAAIDALALAPPDEDDVPARWLGLLAAEVDPPGHEAPELVALNDPGALAAQPWRALREALPAIERGLAGGTRLRSRRSRERTASAAAAFAALAGDGERLALLDAAREAAPLGDGKRMDELDAGLSLLAGDEARFEVYAKKARALGPLAPFLQDVLGARETGDFTGALMRGDLLWIHKYPNPELERLLAGRSDAELGEVARKLDDLRSGYDDSYRQLYRTLRIFAPTMERREGSLLRWMQRGRRRLDWECDPTCQIAVSRDLARAAEALGDPALATALRARADRFYQALLRRELAVPLAVIDGVPW